ncbi:hypothetical protein IV64_GL002349 [Lactiplantibacillus xiangfangensis]|uniref:Uncharacterized protein n=1 Tax=Lactiplantibacillus xiangfangensis TaxID=942150 RepID=A0A0R2MCW5_9LACO|nr:hypothetical protein IV64_GL002349 [Lactiplantibacillus xiangfangensis]
MQVSLMRLVTAFQALTGSHDDGITNHSSWKTTTIKKCTKKPLTQHRVGLTVLVG